MHNGGGGLVAKSCPTLETLWTVCSLPGYSVHRILQARILQWVAISFSRFLITSIILIFTIFNTTAMSFLRYKSLYARISFYE